MKEIRRAFRELYLVFWMFLGETGLRIFWIAADKGAFDFSPDDLKRYNF